MGRRGNQNRGRNKGTKKTQSATPPSPVKHVSWQDQDHRTPANYISSTSSWQETPSKPQNKNQQRRRRNRNRGKARNRGPKAEMERSQNKIGPRMSKPMRPTTPSSSDNSPKQRPQSKGAESFQGGFKIDKSDLSWVPPTHSPMTSPKASLGQSKGQNKKSASKLNPNVAEFVPMTTQQVPTHYYAPAGINPFAPADPSVPTFFAPNRARGSTPVLYPEVINPQNLGHAQRPVQSFYDQEQLDLSPPAGFEERLKDVALEFENPLRDLETGDDPDQGCWVLYWNPPTSLKHSNSGKEYLKGIKALVTFEGIDDFWGKLMGQRKPSQMGSHTGAHNLMIFRQGLIPAWESFPFGGCWILTFPRNVTKPQFIDSAWESLMFMMVSEGFGTQQVVGASLHIRGQNYRITVWNRDNRDGNPVRFEIADQLRVKLNLGNRAQLAYKNFQQAIQDGSTTRRGTNYEFVKVRF